MRSVTGARRSGGRVMTTGMAPALLGLVLIAAPTELAAQSPAADVMAFADPTTGQWYIDSDSASFYFGNPGDSPFLGDWNCNGEATPGLYRSADGFAYLRNSNTQGTADIRFYFGNPSDVPLAGDFNGDGCDSLSLYRPENQTFYIINKLGSNEAGLGAADYQFVFGNPGDQPFIGDFDGDGIDEVGLHREATGFVYYRETLTTGVADNEFFFGDPGDRFVAGDWGVVDGVDTPAVFRPSTTTCYFRHSNSQGIAESQYPCGQPQFIPLRMTGGASFRIDAGVTPEMQSMPGLDGGPDRPIGAVMAPDGSRDEFIANEIILHPQSQVELDAFLATYGGTIVRDGRARSDQSGETPDPAVPADSGWYLIRIDPSSSTLDDLAGSLRASGLAGDWVFSSEDAARLGALALRERARQLSPNFVASLPQACNVCEHPALGGGNLDAADWWWMTEDDDPATPGEQGLSIGVIHAWEYLLYQGYPREGVPYVPVKVAVIDTGFDLDTITGLPLNGNKDYFYSPPRPLQLDEVDGDWRAGGAGSGFSNCNGCWHGQRTFGTCCSFARNSWGTAGIANGSEIRTLLLKVTGDFWVIATAVNDALYNNAVVINMSIAADCDLWCHTFDDGNVLKAHIGSARNTGTIVVSSAGNSGAGPGQGKDISGDDFYPCELSGSICVAAIDFAGNAQQYSNWGSVVDIWAPAGIRSTVTRDSAKADATTTNDNVGIDELDEFHGTSASAPFVVGVVAMMKMLNGNLFYSDVQTILAATALPSTDAKVTKGYIDAFAAVEAAKPNQPPTVDITTPAAGATTPYHNVWFGATVTDPEKPNTPYVGQFPTTLEVRSHRDGLLCTDKDAFEAKGCEAATLSLGAHVITATATDAFGATATDAVAIVVANAAPTANITYPLNGSSFYTSQSINLRGWGFDTDEAIPQSGLQWTSSISGNLGTGGDIWVTLPAGTHTITLAATDSLGATGTDSITVSVVVGTGYPTAQILQPPSGSLFAKNTLIAFVGQGTDPEDGTLTGASLVWSDDIDGPLGTGTNISSVLSSGACGFTAHQVTLTVTDSTAQTDTHTIQVSVGTIC